MAVYFAPKRQDYTLGIIDLLGRHVLAPMMDRTSQAKQFEYEQRLLAEDDRFDQTDKWYRDRDNHRRELRLLAIKEAADNP